MSAPGCGALYFWPPDPVPDDPASARRRLQDQQHICKKKCRTKVVVVTDRNWIPTKAWAQVVGVGRRRTEDDARPMASGRRGRARERRQVGLRGLWRKK